MANIAVRALIAWVVALWLAAVAPARAETAGGGPTDEQRLVASYFRGFMMARYCARHGATFSEADTDRIQDELNRIIDATSLSEDDKARIWNALQSNLNSMGGEVTGEDCAEVKAGLLKLMPQAFAGKPDD